MKEKIILFYGGVKKNIEREWNWEGVNNWE